MTNNLENLLMYFCIICPIATFLDVRWHLFKDLYEQCHPPTSKGKHMFIFWVMRCPCKLEQDKIYIKHFFIWVTGIFPCKLGRNSKPARNYDYNAVFLLYTVCRWLSLFALVNTKADLRTCWLWIKIKVIWNWGNEHQDQSILSKSLSVAVTWSRKMH